MKLIDHPHVLGLYDVYESKKHLWVLFSNGSKHIITSWSNSNTCTHNYYLIYHTTLYVRNWKWCKHEMEFVELKTIQCVVTQAFQNINLLFQIKMGGLLFFQGTVVVLLQVRPHLFIIG